MRTAAVSELITPLKNPIVTGLSMNEILIFSKLSAEELADLASYRCITKQRTILHRIVMIGDELESNGQVKEQFFENLKHLFQKLPTLTLSLIIEIIRLSVTNYRPLMFPYSSSPNTKPTISALIL